MAKTATPALTFFPTAARWRAWLENNHATHEELWVGFHKVGSGTPCMSWSESVDQALCFGWIDGVRKGVDPQTYCIRFTPRKRGSIWSTINIHKMEALEQQGLMQDAGRKAFGERTEAKSSIYSHERAEVAALTAAEEAEFRANAAAWTWFQTQPPSYRNTATHLVVSAKKAETRRKRLVDLVENSAQGQRIKQLRPTGK